MYTAPTTADAEQVAFDRAVELVQQGQLTAGAQQFGVLAQRTTDELLCSKCLHALAQVCHRVERIDEAYALWRQLSHKPPARRNEVDLSARMHVNALFARYALRFQPPDFPPRVQIEITNRCNLHCVMCSRNQMRRSPADLSFEHFQKIVDECSQQPGVVLQLFYLGESLLHPQFDEMVAYADSVKDRSRVRLRFGLQTNGMLLDRGRAERLLEAGLREIHFSFDALEDELERLRPGAEYATIERNLLDLLELRQQKGIDDVVVQISKLCDDIHAESVIRFCQRWHEQVDRINLLPYTRIAGNSYLDATGNIQSMPSLPPANTRRYCGQGDRLIVLASGDFAFCHGDINHEIRLGNVDQRSIRETWNSDEMAVIRERVSSATYTDLAPCSTCPHSRPAPGAAAPATA